MELLKDHSQHLESNLTQCKAIATELEMELNSLRDERDHLQEENNYLHEKSNEKDYAIETQKYQLEQYTKENKLLRELIRLWA